MRKTYTVSIGVLGLVLFLVGCTAKQSRLKDDYGNSHRIAIANQTLNPEAEKNLEPVEGLDGQAGNAIIKRYQEGFEKPSPKPIFPFELIKFTEGGK